MRDHRRPDQHTARQPPEVWPPLPFPGVGEDRGEGAPIEQFVPIEVGPLSGGIDGEAPADEPPAHRPGAVLNRLHPTQNQLRIRLANGQRVH